MKRLVAVILILVLALTTVVLIRTLLVKSKQVAVNTSMGNVAIPPESVQHLAQAIRVATVSHADASQNDYAQWLVFHQFLTHAIR